MIANDGSTDDEYACVEKCCIPILVDQYKSIVEISIVYHGVVSRIDKRGRVGNCERTV